MARTTLVFLILLLSAALPLVAGPQQQESLGDLARQLREQRNKDTKKATKIFTNDNLPAPVFGEPVSKMAAPPASPSATTQTASKSAAPPSAEEAGAKETEPPEDKSRTRGYWQDRFKAARQDVAKAREQQQLSEDELNLLQIQQAREMDGLAKEDLAAKVQAKQSEVDTNKTTMETAQKALADLEKEFKESGAPEDWSETE